MERPAPGSAGAIRSRVSKIALRQAVASNQSEWIVFGRELNMPQDDTFAEFVDRIRAGDDEAARELVERYEPVVRREVRLRLRDQRLSSRFDWTDICQSVMASFFVRAAAGQYDLDRSDQLTRLLVVMTRHKLAQQVRRHNAERRDYRRVQDRDPAYLDARMAPVPTPSRILAGRELLNEFRRRLSDDERRLADLRADGCEWSEIATKVGGTPEALRKQFARAIDRIERQLEREPGGS